MRRALCLAPALLLACTFRPFTPAVSVAYWADDVPPVRAFVLPTFEVLRAKWQLPPEIVWSRYGKLTLMTSIEGAAGQTRDLPDVDALDVVHDAEQAAVALGKVMPGVDVMWFVDLRGAASVAFGSTLSQQSQAPVAPVLTFNNWPADNEMVPAEETLAALLRFTPKLPAPGSFGARPVFLFDAWRLAYRDDTPEDDTVDNRYALGPADLPAPEVLLTRGVKRVMYVVEDLDETEREEDDLHLTLRAYLDAGIEVYLVDLAWLSALKSWTVPDAQRLLIPKRTTLLEDPAFYKRAHGGFGGIHARPSPFRFGPLHPGGFGG